MLGENECCGYIRTLGDKMTPSLQRPAGKGILQHDNNPQETAKITQKKAKYVSRLEATEQLCTLKRKETTQVTSFYFTGQEI